MANYNNRLPFDGQLKQRTESYKKRQKTVELSNFFRKIGVGSGFSAAEKHQAAQKLEQHRQDETFHFSKLSLNGNLLFKAPDLFTPTDIAALQQGKLGNLLKQNPEILGKVTGKWAETTPSVTQRP